MAKLGFHDVSINGALSKPPKRNYATIKSAFKHIDKNWTSDLLDMIEYGTKNKREGKFNSNSNDNFSKYGRGSAVETKTDETLTNEFSNFNYESNRKLILFETDDGKEFVNETAKGLLINQ